MDPRPSGPKEIDGCLCLLTDHLITGLPLRYEPAQEKWFMSNHPYI